MPVALALLVSMAGLPPNPTRQSPQPGLATTARAVGEEAPLFELPQAEGGTFSLKQALARGPVAVVFYRGFW
jgi:hypothetical protein